MKRRLSNALGLTAWVVAVLAGSPADAQTVAAGPYYANPSWDQTLPCTAPANCPRFVVLSNMNSAAVLDRETGLVWERSPTQLGFSSGTDPVAPLPWSYITLGCLSRTVGGRMGWRAPTVDELASLLDPAVSGPGPALPPGHPFVNVQASPYWTATVQAGGVTSAFIVQFAGLGADSRSTSVGNALGWCVRGASHAQAY